MFTVRIPRLFDGGVIEDAFHGTDSSAASTIAKRGFRLPERPTGQYGQAIYFFEGDYRAAAWYARKTIREKGIQDEPVVVRARVELGRTLYLNLATGELERLRLNLEQRLKKEVTPNEACRVLCEALNRAETVDSLKAVRSANKQGVPPHFRAEVVVIVLNPKKVRVLEVLTLDEFKKETTLAV